MLPTPNPMAGMGSADHAQRLVPSSTPADELPPRWRPASGRDPEFRRALADLAARFASVETEGIGRLVVESLTEISEILGADRASIWWQPAGNEAAVTFDWAHPSLGSTEPLDLAEIHSESPRLHTGQPVWFSGLEEVCDLRPPDTLLQQSLRTAVVVPIRSPEETTG